MNFRHPLLAVIAASCSLLLATTAAAAQAANPAAAEVPADTEAKIAALIEQLGNDDFATRQRAQTQLSRMGLEAFDALVAAQYHEVMEVQMRSRFLVRGMTVRWYEESDPPEVARLLKSFGTQNDDERKSRIDRLGTMQDMASINALCRLARYEVNPVLSKHAALLIMHREEPKTPEGRAELAAAIAKGMGTSKRPAAGWLQLYSRTLRDRAAANEEWQTVLKKERRLEAEHPSQTSRQVIRDLYRWQIKSLQQLQRKEEVIALMRESIDLLDPNSVQQVSEFVDWLVHREAWDVVIEVGDRFPDLVANDPLLLYLRAHAYLQLKKPDEAKELVAAALKLRSENLEEHIVVAGKLGENWGLFDFSEQEYREIIKKAAPGSYADFKARFQLSEQLHDQGRELAAAETLKPAVDLMFPDGDEEKGEVARETARRALRLPEGARSRMHYFFSRHYNEQKQFDKEKKSLGDALASDPTDADVLIARYRLPNLNAGERMEINDQIDETAEKFRQEINDWREAAEEATDEQERASCNFQLALHCNQFAWLVGNTRGDYDEALKWSLRSVEIRTEEGGYWDTLGRCYFAKGDLENAVKTQTRAVKLQPHSGQIRRQLELFEKALADKKAAGSAK